MRKSAWRGIVLVAAAAALASAGPVHAADEPAHGWKQAGTGLWEDLPGIRAGYSDTGIAVELDMLPGTGVAWSRGGTWAADNALLRMSTDAVGTGENEYRPDQARFPASATFVFGKDALPLGVKRRILLFFRQLKNGFRPSGIRLTYAWGTRLPVGSMYRLWEEETVFILAGPQEAGKTISTARILSDDFKAAYGRPPKGPVTRVLVEARRPSRDKGAAHTSITVRFPAE